MDYFVVNNLRPVVFDNINKKKKNNLYIQNYLLLIIEKYQVTSLLLNNVKLSWLVNLNLINKS